MNPSITSASKGLTSTAFKEFSIQASSLLLDSLATPCSLESPSLVEHEELSSFKLLPSFFTGQRLGSDDSHSIIGCGHFRKVQGVINIDEFSCREGWLTNKVMKAIPNRTSRSSTRPRVGKECILTTSQEEVEYRCFFVSLDDLMADAAKKSMQYRKRR